MAKWDKKQYSDKFVKESMIPRLLWVRTDFTLKELHFHVFKHMRFVFAQWADVTHPETEYQFKDESRILKTIVPFPYRRNPDDPQMTRAQFDALSDEEAFAICCRDILENQSRNFEQCSPNFDLERGAYQLEFKNTAGHYSTCKICSSMSCKGCLVPYSDDETIATQLNKYGLSRNDTLFEQAAFNRGRELICTISWHKSINIHLFDFMATAMPGKKLDTATEDERPQSSEI